LRATSLTAFDARNVFFLAFLAAISCSFLV
jgi:hypothetical protein